MRGRTSNSAGGRPSMVFRGLAAALVIALAACTDAPPADRTEPTSPRTSPGPPATTTGTPSSAGSPSVAASPAPDLGSLLEPGDTSVRLTPPPGGSFLVRGRYPWAPTRCRDPEPITLTGRFPGTLRISRADDGTLSLTVALSFDRYLEGIAEVPSSWPKAALEAQAVAARSYALATTGWAGAEGEALDTAICATASCQVYRGIPVPRDPTYRRWVRAVHRTDGLVLLSGGLPATTVYFSTSNGRTYANEDVFGSAPLSYLRPMVESDDGASPTSRWRARLPFGDLTRFLRAARLWPRGRPIASADPGASAVTFRGGGETRTIGADDIRDAVNIWSPCLEPRSYPPPVEGGRLPLTIPSHWLRFSTTDRALVVNGRGWGHGVGMVQWGAYGKARKGRSTAEILAFYYGGLTPRHHPEPGLIRVEVASGLVGIRIAPSGAGGEIEGTPFAGAIAITGRPRLEIREAG